MVFSDVFFFFFVRKRNMVFNSDINTTWYTDCKNSVFSSARDKKVKENEKGKGEERRKNLT